MVILCSYTCSYCGRAIETSFVTIGERHYHAIENQFGEKTGLSCYDRSDRGTKTLSGSFSPAPPIDMVQSVFVL